MHDHARGFAPVLLLVIGVVLGMGALLFYQSLNTTPAESPSSVVTSQPPASNEATYPQPEPTATLTQIPVLDTSDWQSASLGGINFKIPPDTRCEDSYTDCSKIYGPPTVINGSTFTPQVPHRFSVVDYEGGSRRVQFAEIYSYQLDFCDPVYEDAYFGKVRALQIAIDGGACQGGDGGAIVAVVGDKLFISWGLQHNTKGVIGRWNVGDTIISTLN